MDVKKVVLLVGALMIAGISALFVRNMLSSAPAQQATAAVAPQPEGPWVLVATKSLPVGTIIDPQALQFQPWPKDMVDQAYFLKGTTDPTTLNGKVVRYAITAGQPVTKEGIVGPGERGFLAAALGPGMRAVTISIDATSGVAGFIFPGDHVDLVMTHEVKLEEQAAPQSGGEKQKVEFKIADTVLSNVRVLAVDQQLTDPEAPKVGQTVTLEVTPKFVEKIAVAQKTGTLSLALRSIADTQTELDAAIASGAVNVKDGQTAADDKAMEAKVASMASDAKPSFTTSGELSAFHPSPSQVEVWKNAFHDQQPLSARSGSKDQIRIARGNNVTVVPLGAK